MTEPQYDALLDGPDTDLPTIAHYLIRHLLQWDLQERRRSGEGPIPGAFVDQMRRELKAVTPA